MITAHSYPVLRDMLRTLLDDNLGVYHQGEIDKIMNDALPYLDQDQWEEAEEWLLYIPDTGLDGTWWRIASPSDDEEERVAIPEDVSECIETLFSCIC